MTFFASILNLTGLSEEEARIYLSEKTKSLVTKRKITRMMNGTSDMDERVLNAFSDLFKAQLKVCGRSVDALYTEHETGVGTNIKDDFLEDLPVPSLGAKSNTMMMIALQLTPEMRKKLGMVP